LQIRTGDLNDERVIAFLEEHLEGMRGITPPESVHALGIGALPAAFAARHGSSLPTSSDSAPRARLGWLEAARLGAWSRRVVE